jgi:hypothetical protein
MGGLLLRLIGLCLLLVGCADGQPPGRDISTARDAGFRILSTGVSNVVEGTDHTVLASAAATCMMLSVDGVETGDSVELAAFGDRFFGTLQAPSVTELGETWRIDCTGEDDQTDTQLVHVVSDDVPDCVLAEKLFPHLGDVDHADGTVYFVGADLTEGDGCYATVNDATDAAVCGDTVVVLPGTYDEQVDVIEDVGACDDDEPFLLTALIPAVDDYDDDDVGAGELACEIDEDHQTTCPETVSFVGRFSAVNTPTIGDSATYPGTNLTIRGFASHGIILQGCENCALQRNFVYLNYTQCIRATYAPALVVEGNYLFRCGGDDTGDADITASYGYLSEIHHNTLAGTGEDNGSDIDDDPSCTGDTVTSDGVITWGGWLTSCSDHFHGTDGWTVNHGECGTTFHHNEVYGHQINGDDGSDGNAIDLKYSQCGDGETYEPPNEYAEPGVNYAEFGVIEVYDNLLYNSEHAQVIVNTANGVRLDSNVIHSGEADGIELAPGGCSSEDWDYGDAHDMEFSNNLIVDNGSVGIRLKAVAEVCGDLTVYDIEIYDNIVADNGAYGLNIAAVLGGELPAVSVWDNIFSNNDLGTEDVYLDEVFLGANVDVGLLYIEDNVIFGRMDISDAVGDSLGRYVAAPGSYPEDDSGWGTSSGESGANYGTWGLFETDPITNAMEDPGFVSGETLGWSHGFGL